MFTGIDLKHFKCFELLKLPLRPLTLLSGANASGKSSVLQALVLLHQTMSEHEWSNRLLLNGGAIRLGTVADVVDQRARRSCQIALRTDDDEIRWEFAGEPADMSMAVMHVWTGKSEWERQPKGWYKAVPPDGLDSGWVLHQLYPWQVGYELVNPFSLRQLRYVSAERTGPQETYRLEDIRFERGVGSSGQYAVSALYAGRDEEVPGELAIEKVPPTRLRQVEAWMGRFFPGCELDLQKIQHTNAVTFGLRTSNDINFHTPVHTGYGLTQVLPVIVAALSSGPKGLLLIENPEVHLHPAGQATMGEFLAEVATTGAQVIMETHSDHVLNGIRRAVKRGILVADDAALHFFQPRRESEQVRLPQVHSPSLDSEGNIDSWPDGFFDQFDKDMNYFAGWG